MEWHYMTSSRMEKLKSTLLAGKVMVTMCGDEKGVIVNYLPKMRE